MIYLRMCRPFIRLQHLLQFTPMRLTNIKKTCKKYRMLRLCFKLIFVKYNLGIWQNPSSAGLKIFHSMYIKKLHFSPIGKFEFNSFERAFIVLCSVMPVSLSHILYKVCLLTVWFQASINRVCSFKLNYSSFVLLILFIAMNPSSGLWQFT